jgi:hypothetical protein
MRHLNKIINVFWGMALGVLALTACEGADLYDNDVPDWISAKADSIAAANESETVLYTVGETDFSSGWWSAFSKYYVIPDGQTWKTTFKLHINPSDNTYYKNFALIITNDNDRGTAGYKEYGAIRYDFTNDTTKYNSLWGDHLRFKYSNSNLVMAPDANNADTKLQKLDGTVTLTVDRSDVDSFKVTMSNDRGIVKTYKQPSPLPNLNSSSADKSIRCFLVPEGAYLEFLSTNIVALGDVDAEPASMTLSGVPDEVSLGTSLADAMKNVSATITYDGNLTKTVGSNELTFDCEPGIDTEGEKTLIAVFNKTYVGNAAEKPIVAVAKFTVKEQPTSIEVTTKPTYRTYSYYTSDATSALTDRTLTFDPAGMVVTGTYPDGKTATIDNSKLTFSTIPASAGVHSVTITCGNAKTSVNVKVAQSTATTVTPSPTTLGATDNSTAWWKAHLDKDIHVPVGETRHFTFTNYTSGANNWKNWVAVLRNSALAEYVVVRADNYGWGNGYSTAKLSGGQADWATWLAAMNGAKVDVYVTNVGNGTADVQAVMHGTDGKTYTQYYLGVSTVDPADLNVDFTVDNCHLVFGSSASAKRHYVHRR